ncbi:MAG TPA: helix-turn-helix domain-containing protein [Ilumatobacter sp.]|nr:helix-turn-helix domain-containing protein [Ilumatobacter sp.]
MRIDPVGDHLGLRERKKLQARRRIAEAAHELFVARGFDQVTIGDVAAAAEMSVKTVFNYFGTKEDLAFEGEDQVIALWINAIRHRDPSLTPLGAVRELVEQRLDAAVIARLDAFADLVGASTDLQSRLRLLWDRLEEALTRVLVAESPAVEGAGTSWDVAVARVEAARVVALPRLFFSDDVRAYLAEASDHTEAVVRWLDAAVRTLGAAPADAR